MVVVYQYNEPSIADASSRPIHVNGRPTAAGWLERFVVG